VPSCQILDLLLPVHGSFSLEAQTALLEALTNDPIMKLLPPRPSFVSRLVKQLIIKAEDEDLELSDDLLELYAELLLKPEASQGGTIYSRGNRQQQQQQTGTIYSRGKRQQQHARTKAGGQTDSSSKEREAIYSRGNRQQQRQLSSWACLSSSGMCSNTPLLYK
jgi:hypothetical protein